MNRILLTTVLLVTATVASDVSADHLDRIRHDYELSRTELRNEYRARREANNFRFHRERDALLAQRERAVRIACHDTRAVRLRAISRELANLSRVNGIRNRDITEWYTANTRALRSEYDLARASVRRVSARPVIVESRIAHPADCTCNTCRTASPRPTYGNAYGYENYDRYDRGYHNSYRGASKRSPNGLDIASLILGILNNR